MDINIGKITENDFKESDAISIAKNVIERNRKFKTYFNEMDKRANLDGSMSIIYNGRECMMIDVQIKALPLNYKCGKRTNQYYYDCDTKVFNVVRLNLTLNPVVLILVDIYMKRVFCILLTQKYVADLHVGKKYSKRIFWGDENEFDDQEIINEILENYNLLNTDTAVEVYVEEIRKELFRKKKIHHKNESLNYYRLVYKCSNIRGFLSNFIWDTDKPVRICLLCMYDVKNDDSEYIQLESEKSIIHLNRSIQRTTATDADIVNILYEVAYLTHKTILFMSAGIPKYIIQRNLLEGDIWRLRVEKLEKDW